MLSQMLLLLTSTKASVELFARSITGKSRPATIWTLTFPGILEIWTAEVWSVVLFKFTLFNSYHIFGYG